MYWYRFLRRVDSIIRHLTRVSKKERQLLVSRLEQHLVQAPGSRHSWGGRSWCSSMIGYETHLLFTVVIQSKFTVFLIDSLRNPNPLLLNPRIIQWRALCPLSTLVIRVTAILRKKNR